MRVNSPIAHRLGTINELMYFDDIIWVFHLLYGLRVSEIKFVFITGNDATVPLYSFCVKHCLFFGIHKMGLVSIVQMISKYSRIIVYIVGVDYRVAGNCFHLVLYLSHKRGIHDWEYAKAFLRS